MGERAKTFLPFKSSGNPSLLVDESRRSGFDGAHQVRQGHRRFQADKNVEMIGHVVDGNELLSLGRNDARHVFLKFIFPLVADQVLSALHGKDDVNVDLRVGIGCETRVSLPVIKSSPVGTASL